MKTNHRRNCGNRRFCQSKVHQFSSALGELDVAGFQVAMHDPAAMRFLQALADFGSYF
jgi:hypothetical protein